MNTLTFGENCPPGVHLGASAHCIQNKKYVSNKNNIHVSLITGTNAQCCARLQLMDICIRSMVINLVYNAPAHEFTNASENTTKRH